MQVRTLNEAHEQRRRGIDGGTGTMRGSEVPGREDKAGQGKARQVARREKSSCGSKRDQKRQKGHRNKTESNLETWRGW